MDQTLRMMSRKRQWDRLKTAKREKKGFCFCFVLFFKKRDLSREDPEGAKGLKRRNLQPGQTQPLQASASGREAEETFPLIPYLPILCHPPETACMAGLKLHRKSAGCGRRP